MKSLGEALAHCSALVWTCDAEGHLTYVSFQNRLPERSGVAPPLLETLLLMVAAEDRQRRARELRCALLDRTGRNHEFLAQWTDGQTVAISEEITPLWNEGEFAGLIGVGTPLHSHQEFTEQADVLAQVGTLNHEVRNCLTGILGTLQLLDDGDLKEKQADRVSAAQQSCETLLGLLQDSLDAHALRAGRAHLKKIGFSPAKSAQAVLTGLETMASDSKAKLLLEVGSEVPTTVSGDPHRLGQILTNLVTNALKYSEGDVTLSLERSGPGISFEVKDNGPGISDEFQKVMFGAYQQEQDSSAGWGLGLGISHSLASLMGGRLECQSGSDGTVFSLWLPLTSTRSPAFASPRGRSKPTKADFQALIVEDQPLVAQALAGQLGKLGVTSRVAESGAQALDELKNRMPELIFLDLHLSGGSGFTLCREIRRLHGLEPMVVGLTGDTAQGTRRRCLESGMNECIFKPMSLSRLSELLQQFRQADGSRREPRDTYAYTNR